MISARNRKRQTLKTVAIVGSHPTTRDLAPYNNPQIPIWVFNAGVIMDWCKRADVVFEMHPAGEYTNPMVERSEYWNDFLQKQTVCKVYMQDADPRIPAAIKYPFDSVVKRFLANFLRVDQINKYFTSSPCYAIALALLYGYERIELYGIEMETNSEYIYQRDGVGLWVGIALGLGVQIVLPQNTTMFSAPLYGYDDDHTQITREDFEDNANALERAYDESAAKLEYAKGRLDSVIAAIEQAKKDGTPHDQIAKMGAEYGDATNHYEQAIANFANINGQLTLCRFYLAKIDKMHIANGQALAVTALRADKIRAHGMVA